MATGGNCQVNGYVQQCTSSCISCMLVVLLTKVYTLCVPCIVLNYLFYNILCGNSVGEYSVSYVVKCINVSYPVSFLTRLIIIGCINMLIYGKTAFEPCMRMIRMLYAHPNVSQGSLIYKTTNVPFQQPMYFLFRTIYCHFFGLQNQM